MSNRQSSVVPAAVMLIGLIAAWFLPLVRVTVSARGREFTDPITLGDVLRAGLPSDITFWVMVIGTLFAALIGFAGLQTRNPRTSLMGAAVMYLIFPVRQVLDIVRDESIGETSIGLGLWALLAAGILAFWAGAAAGRGPQTTVIK